MIELREDLGLKKDDRLKFASLELSPPPLDHSSSTSLLYPPGFEPINGQTGPSVVGMQSASSIDTGLESVPKHVDVGASSFVKSDDDMLLADLAFKPNRRAKNVKNKESKGNSNMSFEKTNFKTGCCGPQLVSECVEPYQSKFFEGEAEAKRSWLLCKSLGLSTNNDEDMINALVVLHIEKEEGTKCACARGKKGTKQKNNS